MLYQLLKFRIRNVTELLEDFQVYNNLIRFTLTHNINLIVKRMCLKSFTEHQ